jgi:hypothetical protein
MTSRGQVTIPEAMPAEAPQTALTLELGMLATTDAMLEKSKFLGREGGGASREDRVAAVGAYRCVVVVGDGGSGASVDMVEADCRRPLKGACQVPQRAATPQHLRETMASD